MNAFTIKRSNIIKTASGLIFGSYYAKMAFFCAGFFEDVVKELNFCIDFVNNDTANKKNNTFIN
jgi:hypothetical protein